MPVAPSLSLQGITGSVVATEIILTSHRASSAAWTPVTSLTLPFREASRVQSACWALTKTLDIDSILAWLVGLLAILDRTCALRPAAPFSAKSNQCPTSTPKDSPRSLLLICEIDIYSNNEIELTYYLSILFICTISQLSISVNFIAIALLFYSIVPPSFVSTSQLNYLFVAEDSSLLTRVLFAWLGGFLCFQW